jgi:hypothetical protein
MFRLCAGGALDREKKKTAFLRKGGLFKLSNQRRATLTNYIRPGGGRG